MIRGLIEPQTSTGLSLNDVSNQRIYTLDVRLFTYSPTNLEFSMTPKEFTGINTLSVEYLKENIGFGITNIDISTNASLQPIIEITFKDLYGNTVFSRNESNEASGMYKDIFDWPPPKFDLVYKGYLGKPTRLMLNLKKTDIQYNSSDSSFTIKCSFVPNTWGPFADIPALFLYAVKKLKVDEGIDVNKVTTFFDLIKIGKRVDTVRKSFSQQYSEIKDKLGQVRGSLALAFTTGEMQVGTKIVGTIQSNGNNINGFNNITVYDYTSTSSDGFKDLKSLKTSGVDSILLSDYFLSKTQVGDLSNFSGDLNKFLSLKKVTANTASDTASEATPAELKEKQKLIDILNAKRVAIDKNSSLVDEVINAEAFAQNETQIAATTISQIFKSLAGDTGYLLGRILKAGFIGYKNNQVERDKNKNLIGKFYPLIIKEQGDGNVINNQEIPEENPTFQNRQNELNFIDEFIQAIAFGLGDAAALEEPLDTKGRRQLIRRLSNLEVLQANPYSPTYNSIIENMVVRSGVYAYFTNSADANTPGDYYRATNINREEPEEAAKGEMENLTDALIKEITPDDVTRLRNSLNYFKKAFNPDEGYFSKLLSSGATGTVLGTSFDSSFDVGNGVNNSFKDVVNGVGLESKGIPPDFSATKIIFNNNLPWFNLSKKYNYVLFNSRNDVEYIRNVNNSPTDSKFKGSEEQDNSGTIFGDEEPPGLVIIDAYAKDGVAGAGRIKYLNTFVDDGQVISYEALISEYQDFLSDGSFDINNCKAPASTVIDEQYGGYPLAYAIYTSEDYVVGDYAWNLFGNKLQQTFLYTLANELLIKLDKIQEEKQIQVATVGARANEQKNSIYIQMHHIFYQWCSLVFNYETENYSSPDNSQQLYNYNELPQKLESLYSSITTESSETVESGFQYLAPLIRYKNNDTPIDVENSIINLDSCYSIDANTTVLNIIQNVCNKNNFLFFPLAGGNVFDVENMFTPQPITYIPKPGNRFVVLWAPTPEARPNDNNGNGLNFIQNKDSIKQPGFIVKFGSTDNALFKNVRVGTDSTKTTAESIVNLQRLVDKQVDNKQVTKDCSTIPVLEGRSYTCEVDTLGNAQISPMQFFYIDNMPIFGGLYQIMEVSHTITPNNFETKFKGMKTRYNAGKVGGIPPVTLNTSRDLAQKHSITGGAPKNSFNTSETIQKILSGLGMPTTGNPPSQGYLTPGNLKLSENGFNLIKRSEGSRNNVYDDKTGRGITSYSELIGFPTIGIGHLITESERGKYSIYLKGKQTMPDKEIQNLFLNDIKPREKVLNNLLKKAITQNMFDALMSLLYNAGSANGFFQRAIKYVNNEQYKEAADEIRLGPKTSKGIIFAGLVRRRNEESDLFLA